MTIDGISLVLLVFVVICMVVYYWSLWSFAWWLEGQHLRTCRAVMQLEMDAVEKNCTWKLADLPSGHSVITLKWVFKLKRDEAGAIVKHKARLVARGFVQREGIDFNDTFAPVARMESVRLFFALAAQEGWRVHHMDVNSAFLNGNLKEEIYVHQPLRFAIPGKEGKVLRLRKALYRLRQGDGLRAKPARGGHLPAGQWRKRPAGGCLRRRLGDHRHEGCGGGNVQGRDEGHLPDE
jgi:hypothetical protein